MKSTNVTRVTHLVSPEERWNAQGHRGGVLWLTGLPASGKKALAAELEARLFAEGYEVYAFDSASIRAGLSSDLGYSRDDRRENIRRAGELAAVMARSGLIVIAAFISPYAEDRARARTAADSFHEVYLDVSLEECEARDQEGRYDRARTGEIPDFTGISGPYETPNDPEVSLSLKMIENGEAVEMLFDYVQTHFRD